MPKFTVSYETTEKPEKTPAGAKVTQLSALPLYLKPSYSGSKQITVEKSNLRDKTVAYLEMDWSDAWLTVEEVDQLIEALTEARGKKPVPEEVEPFESKRGGKGLSINAQQSTLNPKALYLRVSQNDTMVYEWLTEEETQGLYRVLKEIHGDA